MTIEWRGTKETMLRMLNGAVMPEGLLRKPKKGDDPDTAYLKLDGFKVKVEKVYDGSVRLSLHLCFKGTEILTLNETQLVREGDSITIQGLKIKSSMVLS